MVVGFTVPWMRRLAEEGRAPATKVGRGGGGVTMWMRMRLRRRSVGRGQSISRSDSLTPDRSLLYYWLMIQRLALLLVLPLVTFGSAPAADAVTYQAAAVKDIKMTLVSEPEPVAGSVVTVNVTLPKRAKGARVSLLRRSEAGGGWVVVQRKRAKKRSVTISGPVTAMGDTKWRAVARDRSGTLHRSNTVRTKVFAWLPLSAAPNNTSDNLSGNSHFRDAVIGGVSYRESLVNNEEWMFSDESWGGYVEVFTLGYKCKTFSASVGVLDASGSGLTVAFSAEGDNSRVDFGTYGLGPATPVSMDVSSVLKLTLNTRSGPGIVNRAHNGYAGWATPQILCSGTPIV